MNAAKIIALRPKPDMDAKELRKIVEGLRDRVRELLDQA